MTSSKTLMAFTLMVILMAADCRIGTGTFVATSNFKDFKELSTTKVKGKSCRVWLLHVAPVGGFNLNDAYASAMEGAGSEANAMANMSVSIERPIPIFGWLMLIPIVAPWECYVVEGYPARMGNVP
ncbi:MAG: hypothetical protein K8S54_16010 [Spirochaetia bacterium]|nr:hypothetical protein [Spirochaetia bacterium]